MKIQRCFLMIAILLLAAIWSGPTASQTMTPTAPALRSLFDDDTCAPPCWFGLTPGKSTTEEVVDLIERRDDIAGYAMEDDSGNVFDAQTGYLTRGHYAVSLANYERTDFNQVYSSIVIDGGIVDSMQIVMNRVVTLSQTLERLGQPDHVRFEVGSYWWPYFTLVYESLKMKVELNSVPSNLDKEGCPKSSLGATFSVIGVDYYPSEASLKQSLDIYGELIQEVPPTMSVRVGRRRIGDKLHRRDQSTV